MKKLIISSVISSVLLGSFSYFGSTYLEEAKASTKEPTKTPIAVPEIHVEIPKIETYDVPDYESKPIQEAIQDIKSLYADIECVVMDLNGVVLGSYSGEEKILSQTPNTIQLEKPNKITFTIETPKKIPEKFEDIDWDSKYYTFSADPNKGSRNVCDKNNNIAWPYARCADANMSFKPGKGWNKMICSSYGSSRFWEVNFPDDPYPLERTWVIDLSNKSATQSGQFKISHNVEDIRERSIISISMDSGNHIGFIEEIREDGNVVVTEANVGSGESTYGWRRWEGKNIQDWISSYKNGKLNGYLYPEIV